MENGDGTETGTQVAESWSVHAWNEERRKRKPHACFPEKSVGTFIHDRLRDRLAQHLRNVEATVDLERTNDEGHSRNMLVHIDFVVTIPGRDE